MRLPGQRSNHPIKYRVDVSRGNRLIIPNTIGDGGMRRPEIELCLDKETGIPHCIKYKLVDRGRGNRLVVTNTDELGGRGMRQPGQRSILSNTDEGRRE
jgi:hypothetical protein